MIRVLVILSLCCGVLNGYKFLQDRIPNGDRVPHPCKENYMWEGVGHKNIAGGGDRNPFGVDFKNNGQVWDECICRRDSDGDGRTNGEELGDPDCVWTPGDIPAKSDGLSHPGVCEPVDSPFCTANNDWDFCQYEELDCPALKEEGVEEIVLRFNRTVIPAQVTSYYCMTFDLDLDPDVEYHIIGSEPLIDNKNVMHHIFGTGCTTLAPDKRISSPEACGMVQYEGCESTGMLAWSVGIPGQCLPAEYGFKAGKGGVKSFLMQYHWNNPEKRSDYTDASAFRIYLTRKLRPADGSIFALGTAALTIPPGMPLVEQEAFCRADCSNHMPGPITLDKMMFHMHYLGRSGKIIHKRNGKILRVLEGDYSYDSPVEYDLTDPIEFRPGDEMTLTCGFRSTSRSHTTYYGLGTYDEMCLGIFYYYPHIPKLVACMSYRSLDQCLMPGVSNSARVLNSTCEMSSVTNIMSIYSKLAERCNSTVCTAECQARIDQLERENDCVGGDVQHMLEYLVLAPFYKEMGVHMAVMLHSCDDDWNPEIFYPKTDDGHDDNNNDSDDGNNDSDDDEDQSRAPSQGHCVFDLDPDVGPIGGVGHTAPLNILVIFMMIYSAVITHM